MEQEKHLQQFYIPEEQSIYLLSHDDAKKLKDWVALCVAQLRQLGYRDVELIGKGAYGFVFAGRFPGLDTPGPEHVFKAFHLPQADRQRAAEACFPTWGAQLSGGFLSHVAGKLFFRTGLKGLQIRIHNITLGDAQNPGQVELPQIALGHLHAESWDRFISAYRFRLARGSYRAELKPQVRRDGAQSLHDLLRGIEAKGGEPALRAFYDEVGTATPALCDRLEREGLLRRVDLKRAERRARHFPDIPIA